MIDFDKEKLICLILVNDAFLERLKLPGAAFWRGFIVEDRATGEISAKFRFKHQDDNRNWYSIKPNAKTPREQQVDHLHDGLTKALVMGLVAFGADPTQALSAIRSFFPPNRGENSTETVRWLEEKDLISVTAVENTKNIS